MLYLLDANVLIRAHEDYYPLDRIPQFWDWLAAEATEGHVKMPFEIYSEIATATGPLKDWITSSNVKNRLVLAQNVDRALLNKVLDTAYAPDLTEVELDEAGCDPFLVAYGLMRPCRAIVTKEISKPTKERGRRKLPDACGIMRIDSMTDFRFYKDERAQVRNAGSTRTHRILYGGSVPGTQVGPHRLSQVMEDPAYLPLVKRSDEHGSCTRSPDQAVVFHRRPDTGSPERDDGKTVLSYGEGRRTKEVGKSAGRLAFGCFMITS